MELLQNTSSDTVVIHTLLTPLFAMLIASMVRNKNYRDTLVIFISAVMFVNVINLFLLSIRGIVSEIIIAEPLPGLTISFFVEPLGIMFAMVASFLWLVTNIYSIGYMRGNKEKRQNQFSAFFSLAIFATVGIALSGNLFTLFIFYELLTLSTYPLVTHHADEESKKSGRVYLGILLSTSICLLLPAIIITWGQTGSVDFEVGGIMAGKVSPALTGVLLFMYMFGIGKAALMPMHKWLPAAMVAPTPVSALLHAVAVVKAGVFTVLKVIVYIFGVENLSAMIAQNWWAGGWLLYISGATILLASFVALRQDNLKLRLAYSTISQLSYVIMATAVLAPLSIVAAGFHIVAHAFGKITLFFAAGSIYTASGKKYVSELNGIGRAMPWTMAAFSLGALSMIGLPPLAGFLSKYYMLLGAFDNKAYFAIGVIIISTLLNAAYLLPIIHAAFFKPLPAKGKKHGEAPLPIIIAITITAAGSVLLFFYSEIFLWLSSLAAGK